MNEDQMKSFMDMANGGFKERVDYEMPGMIRNILDPNTPTKFKRKLTITAVFEVDETRQNIAVHFEVKSALAPTKPLTTFLYVADEHTIVEMAPQIPGQQSMDGTEQGTAPILKLVQNN